MKSISLTVLGFVLAVASAAHAQPHPNFSGVWSMDLSRSESAMQSDPIGPTTVAIEQTSAELKMTTTRDGKSTTVVYRLDGATGQIPGGTATSHWNGSSLVTEIVRTIQGQTVTANETRRLNAAGDELLVDSVLVVQHGYTVKGVRNYGAGRDVFTLVR
jgi:hypothetical protein